MTAAAFLRSFRGLQRCVIKALAQSWFLAKLCKLVASLTILALLNCLVRGESAKTSHLQSGKPLGENFGNHTKECY